MVNQNQVKLTPQSLTNGIVFQCLFEDIEAAGGIHMSWFVCTLSKMQELKRKGNFSVSIVQFSKIY